MSGRVTRRRDVPMFVAAILVFTVAVVAIVWALLNAEGWGWIVAAVAVPVAVIFGYGAAESWQVAPRTDRGARVPTGEDDER